MWIDDPKKECLWKVGRKEEKCNNYEDPTDDVIRSYMTLEIREKYRYAKENKRTVIYRIPIKDLINTIIKADKKGNLNRKKTSPALVIKRLYEISDGNMNGDIQLIVPEYFCVEDPVAH